MLNVEELQKQLGTKICEISALKEIGIEELIDSIKTLEPKKNLLIYNSNIEAVIMQIGQILSRQKHKRFLAVKLLEQDKRFAKFNTYQISKITNDIQNNYNLKL